MMMTTIIVYSPLLFLMKINLDECVGNQKISMFSLGSESASPSLDPFPSALKMTDWTAAKTQNSQRTKRVGTMIH